jgi:hypothetical protein
MGRWRPAADSLHSHFILIEQRRFVHRQATPRSGNTTDIMPARPGSWVQGRSLFQDRSTPRTLTRRVSEGGSVYPPRPRLRVGLVCLCILKERPALELGQRLLLRRIWRSKLPGACHDERWARRGMPGVARRARFSGWAATPFSGGRLCHAFSRRFCSRCGAA